MPIPTTPVAGLGVAPTGSPFWLRVNGLWAHVEGVAPSAARATNRARSELVTTDGVRYAQQAPRAPREWSIEAPWAVPATAALLSVAAEAPGDVWLLDQAAACANMLRPRDCYGHDETAPALLCGTVPLRAFPAGHIVETMVRGGVGITVSAWSTAAAGTELATITHPGGSTTLTATGGLGDATAATVALSASVDGDLVVQIEHGAVAGLMVAEVLTGPALPPVTFLAGEATPCRVEVADLSRELLRTPLDGHGLANYATTLREVGA